MHVLYISQDGEKPSGVSTCGYHVLEGFASARLLLLNATQPPAAAARSLHDRITCVPESESHDVCRVAQHLRNLTATLDGPVVILPNTGDTPWNATVEFIRVSPSAERERFRVLGIVHSDVETQYANAVRHRDFARVWLGVSRRCAGELHRRLEGRETHVHVLPYPMPVPEFAANANRDRPLRLVYSGRLEEPQKRVSRLAHVFSELAARGVEYVARVAGDGPAREDFITAIQRGPAASHVQLLGAVDHGRLAEILQESDLLLLTSAYEGLPLAMLEAMAAGVCPVVMYIKSGLDDAVTSGQDAIVVPQGNAAAMTQAIVELDRDRVRLEALKGAARERISRTFSPEHYMTHLAAIIEETFRLPPPDPDLVMTDPTALAVAQLVDQARLIGGNAVVYGAGMFGRKVVDACLDAGIPIVAWFDSDPARRGLSYRGATCLARAEIRHHTGATFLVGSLEFADEITALIQGAARDAGHNVPRIVSASSKKHQVMS